MKKLLTKSMMALLAVLPFAVVHAEDGLIPREYQAVKPDSLNITPLDMQESASFSGNGVQYYCLQGEPTMDASLLLKGERNSKTTITLKLNGKVVQLTSWKTATDTIVGKYSINRTNIQLLAPNGDWNNLKLVLKSMDQQQEYRLRLM